MKLGSPTRIAFVLNKELTNTSNTIMKVLIPGYTTKLILNWHNNETIKILNIYALNHIVNTIDVGFHSIIYHAYLELTLDPLVHLWPFHYSVSQVRGLSDFWLS